jgi:CO dehydrogenase/acetyl-CoA synthase gamma subunit (corrinoid Fe-S protein)
MRAHSNAINLDVNRIEHGNIGCVFDVLCGKVQDGVVKLELGAKEVLVSYSLTFTQKPTYLHAVVTGSNTKENVTHYLEEIHRECTARRSSKLLIEERLVGPRLGTVDVFQIAVEGSRRAQGKFKAIAFVDVNAQGDLMKFSETVATNRGLPVKVFASVADAEKWLLDDDGNEVRAGAVVSGARRANNR